MQELIYPLATFLLAIFFISMLIINKEATIEELFLLNNYVPHYFTVFMWLYSSWAVYNLILFLIKLHQLCYT